ncbi:hypothetical protein B7G68_16735 [Caulobacter segnis]|uniref:STS1 protein n=2 Tax=Caulobacter segnis TaxID=88688 RepID=D5VMI1_CAUST|nr:hypothetical protein [Caulobacter segnis]ADG11704.1 STS1 protein [Caulobacter segnis ATCC 21756]AVQ03347.1 hypothetical protein B7G68_16735 [Caulobacter segnis]
MAAQVLSFFQRSPRYAPAPAADWTQQELAEFYRVEAALIRAGIRVGTDRGLSDEKEPWFVFYRTDDGEVVIHFARIDGEYMIAGPAYEEIARGFDFSSMVRNMVARHPLIRRSDRGDNISIHPAALLVAVVGTAFFKSGEARAAESGASNPPSHARPALLSSTSNTSLNGGAAALPPVAAANAQSATYDTVQLPANQAILVLAAALLAADFNIGQAGLASDALAALETAPAAPDFTAAAAPELSPAGGDASILPGHAAAVASTPAQTASSVLSLVALLSTMPQSPATTALPEASQTLAVEEAPARHDAAGSPLPAPALHEGADWVLEIRLGVGALPNVEAVQLVRALVGETALAQKIAVIEVSKLPDVLAEIISRGEHVQVAPISVQPEGHPDADLITPDTPAPAAGGEVVTPSTPAEPLKTNAHVDFVSMDLVRQVIDSFMAHTASVGFAMDGSQVVMYDTRVTTDPGAISHITSLTFELPDHSSINLVGDHSAFLGYGFLF